MKNPNKKNAGSLIIKREYVIKKEIMFIFNGRWTPQ